MNSITKKDYNAIKNDRTYTVITYEKQTNERHCTYSGMNIIQATDYIIDQQKYGRRAILLHNINDVGTSWDMNDYEDAIKSSSPPMEE